jgi:hypothetical protein
MTDAAYSDRLPDALRVAARWHRTQVRKGTQIPYLSHLIGTCAVVLDHGGTEDEAIAALLHDVIEDTNHDAGDIERRFGPRVAEIVVACTDADPPPGQPKPPWKPRKDTYIAHLEHVDDQGILLVSAADKFSNLSAIVADGSSGTAGLWARFKGGLGGTVWYYGTLVEVLTARLERPRLADSLRLQLARLLTLADEVRAPLSDRAARVEAVLHDVNPARWTDAEGEQSAPWLALELARRATLAVADGDDRPATDLTATAVDVMHRWYGDTWDAADLPSLVASLR